MDALDKLFVICAAISIIITAVFGYLVPVIMSIIYYAVIAAVLFFVFNFARLI